jgi:hypothetical protein
LTGTFVSPFKPIQTTSDRLGKRPAIQLHAAKGDPMFVPLKKSNGCSIAHTAQIVDSDTQHDRNPVGSLNADGMELEGVTLEDFPVKEQDGGESQVLSARRDFSIDRQGCQELVDRIAAHFERVPPFTGQMAR